MKLRLNLAFRLFIAFVFILGFALSSQTTHSHLAHAGQVADLQATPKPLGNYIYYFPVFFAGNGNNNAPEATPTPEDPLQVATDTPVPTPTSSIKATNTRAPTVTRTPRAATPTRTPKVSPTPPAATPVPIETASPTTTPEPAPAETETPVVLATPTKTPKPKTATPTPETVPDNATNNLLDNFNRSDGAPGEGWVGDVSVYAISNNALRATTSEKILLWHATFGSDQFISLRLANSPASGKGLSFILKAWQADGTEGYFAVRWSQSYNGEVFFYHDNWYSPYGQFPFQLQQGDTVSVRVQANGLVTVSRNGTAIANIPVNQPAGQWDVSRGGQIGFVLDAGVAVDDVSGGASSP